MPTGSFFLFMMDYRAKREAEGEKIDWSSICRVCADLWKTMSEEQKKPFKANYEQQRKEY